MAKKQKCNCSKGLMFLRGLFALVLGILALSWPGLTFAAFILYFGIFAIMSGLVFFIYGLLDGEEFSMAYIMSGLFEIILGVLMLWNPVGMIKFAEFMIALWALFVGVTSIAVGIKMVTTTGYAWLNIALGILSILFAVALFTQPTWLVAYGMIIILGAYSIVSGIFTMAGSLFGGGCCKAK